MTALTVHCPHCQAANEFHILDIPDAEAINCSSCRKPLGTWGQLQGKTPYPVTGVNPAAARVDDPLAGRLIA